MMIEELKQIQEGDEKWAQIANFSRYWISDLGRIYNVIKHQLVKQSIEWDGYILVSIKNDDNEIKSKRVHRLVAEAFLSNWNPEWPWTVNHINGKKDDNRLCNLEMLTTQDNTKHYQTAECFKESRKLNRVRTSESCKKICADPEYRKGMSDRQKQNWNDPKYREAMMSNNQDRMWVHNKDSEKWIHEHELNDYIQNGYVEGRLKTNFKLSTAGKVRIHKGNQSRFILPEELTVYLQEGWSTGRADRKHVKCIETGEVFSSVEECAKAFDATVDLIHARCKGTSKTFRKLKGFTFCYYEDPSTDLR